MKRTTRLLSAAALLATPLVAIAAAAPAAHAATSRIKVSLIGDQSVVGLRDAGKASHTPLTSTYRVNFDTTACRQTVVPGSNTCAVIGVPNTALSIATSNRGDLGEVVVMATGYNDPPPVTNAINAVMTELTTHGVQKVIWLNLRVSSASNPPTGAQLTKWQTFNSTLTTLAGGTWAGKLRVADWNAASTGQDGWFRTGGTDPVQSQIEIRANEPGPAALAGFIKGQIDAIAPTVTPAPPPTPPAGSRCSGSNAIGVPSSGPTTVPVVTDAANSLYKAITPQRLLDTRAGRSALNITDRMLGTGRLYRLNVTDGFGSDIPTYATAVSLNVTVSTPCAPGYATVFPCNAPPDTGSSPLVHRPPNASNLNFTPGVLVPNAVISKLGELGRICLYTSAQTDLIVDATGYYSDSTPTVSSAHQSLTPQRLFDTRPGRAAVFNLGHPIAGTHRQVVTVSPAGVVPAGIAGIALNVGITAPAAPGFLSVTPGNCPAPGSPAPNTSNLNFSAGQTVANQVQVQVPGSGKVCVYTSATTDVFIDAFGIFLAPGSVGDGLRAQTPLRLLDTRPGRSAASPDKTPIGTNQTKTLNVAAYGHLPAGTHAVVLNVTAVNEAAPGYLSVFPCTGGNHTVSNINFTTNVLRPNLVDVSIAGGVCLFASAKTDVIVDLAGWYQP